MIVSIIIFFLIACVTSLVLTALVREVAPRIGLTDRPDGYRKLHEKPMPLGGGICIFLAMAGVIGPLLIFRQGLLEAVPDLPALLLAGAVIVIVGLIDDRVGLSGRQKLCGQLVAVSILMFSGLLIEKVGMFGLKAFDLKWFSIPFTLFWLLGAINALNLLDGIDGLATMMGIILVATIAAMAFMVRRYEVALVASVFAGSLVGFIRFNFPPASIFLGDTGSMLIGLVVGALAIQGSLKGPGTVLLAAPLAVWAIPIFDSAAAILRRKLTGRSIYTTDRGHLHHRLLSLLGSNRKVLVWLAVCCTLTSVAALLSVFLREKPDESGPSDLIALLTCSAIVIIFIATGVFGRAELLLLGNRLRRMGRSLVPPIAIWQARIRETTVRLQGSRRWELLWETFIESAEGLPLNEIRLDVNLPAAGEGYHASWERPSPEDSEQCWRMELPLVVADHPVGRLLIVGELNGDSACQDIQQLLDLVEPFETQLLAVSGEKMPVPAADDNLTGVREDNGRSSSALSRERPR